MNTLKPFNPRVTILIPVYNGSNYLSQAIDSALAQTYKNIEVLVVNDGSSDNGATEEIASSYGDRIKYISKPNGGVASALNLGVKCMSGEYFSWLSHDDLYVPEKIEQQIRALSNMTDDRAILYSDYSVFATDPEQCVPMRMKGVIPQYFRHWLTVENALHGCTLLIPKIAFSECGEFNETLRTTQDYDLWFRMAERFNFCHLPQLLVKARSHVEQGSIAMADIARNEANTLLSGFVRSLSVDEIKFATEQSLALAYARIAASMWHRGFLPVGWSAAELSLRYMPTSPLREGFQAFLILTKGFFMCYFMRAIRNITTPRLRLALKSLFTQKPTPLKEFGPDFVVDMNLKDKFSEVYEKNIFKGRQSRSGEGSDLIQTAVIRHALPELIKELNITSFLDAPCGDWYWMRAVNLGVSQYIGVDIVEALINKNKLEFSNEKTSFHCMNLAESDLPKVDLIFSRDCLVHLSFEDALKIISNFKRSGSKYLLTTTFTNRTENEDLGQGFWRPLNKQLAPFNFPPPIRLINEACTEGNGQFTDKCLGLWLLSDIKI